MSQLTDYAENKLVDMIRAQAWALPANLYASLASAASDSAVTELTGTGYARVGMVRALTTWAGTLAAGGTAASTGTSHASSNSAAVNFGTSGSAWGTASFVVLYDAATAGNPICAFPITALVIGSGQPVSIATAALTFTLGLTGGCSDYLANKLIDFIFRGQAFTFPATMYEALLTSAPVNAGGGTEVAGGLGYARMSLAGSLATLAGTQAAGSLTASTGTGGQTSNNAAITFGTPTGSWGTVGWAAEYDAASAGNLLFWAPLANAKTVSAGSTPPSFAAGTRTITFA